MEQFANDVELISLTAHFDDDNSVNVVRKKLYSTYQPTNSIYDRFQFHHLDELYNFYILLYFSLFSASSTFQASATTQACIQQRG
jgi:hypothetical protein